MKSFLPIVAVALACGVACSSNSSDSTSLFDSSATPLENWNALSRSKGCKESSDLKIPEACSEKANTQIECFANYLEFCSCENSGSLNCEGTYKAKQGTDACASANTAYNDCEKQ